MEPGSATAGAVNAAMNTPENPWEQHAGLTGLEDIAPEEVLLFLQTMDMFGFAHVVGND